MSTIITQGLNSPLYITEGYGFSSTVPSGGTLPPNIQANIIPPDGFISAGHEDLRCNCVVSATGAFNVDLISSHNPESEPTYVIKQSASTTVTVDGNQSGYTESLELDIEWPAIGKIVIFNPGVADITWSALVSLYRGGGG